MGLYEQWPYVNFHELNMNWIIQVIKAFQAEYAEFKIDWENLQNDWEAQQQAFQALQQFVTEYFDNLDVQQEINNKLDEMAEDGTLWDLMEPYVSSELEQIRVFVLPEMFGAVGDNITDDTVAIQDAINYAQTNNMELRFRKKQYKTTAPLIITKAINIYGDNCFINGNDSEPTIKIESTAEIRNYAIKKLGVRNYGSGNALEISGTYSFITCLISECSFYAASGWGLKVGENFSHTKVQMCTFAGNGVYAECGDANIFEKNLFYGQNTTGIYLNTPSYGELNNAIINNTIANAGYAILIDSGDQTWICNNQIEYNGSSDSTNNPSAMLYLRGNTRAVKHCVIENNNFGGGTHLNYCIYINCGDENVIKANRFVAVNTSEIHVQNGGATGSKNNYYYESNEIVSTTQNPRTDKYQPVKVTSVVSTSIIGVWQEITLTDSTDTLKVKKCIDGSIMFAPTTWNKLTTALAVQDLCTLPMSSRPEITTYVTAWWTGSGTPEAVPLKIRYNGLVSFLESKTFNSCEIMIPSITAPLK